MTLEWMTPDISSLPLMLDCHCYRKLKCSTCIYRSYIQGGSITLPSTTIRWWLVFYVQVCAHARLNGGERFPKVMKRSQRWNTLHICPRRDSNTGGSDLWSNTLRLDHGGADLLCDSICTHAQWSNTLPLDHGGEPTTTLTVLMPLWEVHDAETKQLPLGMCIMSRLPKEDYIVVM